jgi:hypothetical protein
VGPGLLAFRPTLGQYVIYQSAYLNCSSIKALNCYFAMPFRRSALITATNEGKQAVGSFYSNIDYQLAPSLPDDICRTATTGSARATT